MKKIGRFLMFFLLGGLLLGGGLFLALAVYYQNSFPVNTWINGVYCTGRTVEEINEELANTQPEISFCLVDPEGGNWDIPVSGTGIRPDFTAGLKSYLKSNASIYWLKNLQEPVYSELRPEKYVMDEGKLREYFETLPFVVAERERVEGVHICRSQDGYYLQDDNSGHLNPEKAYSYLRDCISRGETMIRMENGDCYEDLPDSEEDRYQRGIWGQICDFTEKCGRIRYDMGAETVEISPDMAAAFLETAPGGSYPMVDEQGRIKVSQSAVQEWVENLAARYDTCGTEREFAATRGDIVTVKYVTYGTKLDVEAEQAYLLEVLQGEGDEAGSMLHVPAYSQQGYVRGLDDIGDTYIEIDMTEQRMYYYADGELTLETDVVTGNTGRQMGTPQGINFVYAKERNRTLRGADYASFVKYWMPVKGNVGIHDASWRTKFGGQIYKTNGSHGCINTPSDIMSQLYELAEVGTPVIMFY